MKIAVIADIHANMEALEAVLADADNLGAAQFLCLGDVIGYGPDPEAAVTQVALRKTVTVTGNHDAALFDPPMLARFSREAQRGIEYARATLSAGTRLWLNLLPRTATVAGALAVHGMPPRSVSRYMAQCTRLDLRRIFTQYDEELCFVGHTHLLELVRLTPDGAILVAPLLPGRMELPEGCRHICSVGSVGQPRGGGREAEYVLWDTENRAILARSVPYDREKTAAKIRKRGLPSSLCRWLL